MSTAPGEAASQYRREDAKSAAGLIAFTAGGLFLGLSFALAAFILQYWGNPLQCALTSPWSPASWDAAPPIYIVAGIINGLVGIVLRLSVFPKIRLGIAWAAGSVSMLFLLLYLDSPTNC